MDEKKIIAALKRIEALKLNLAKNRDELRTALSDLEDIIESMDYAEEQIDSGIRSIRDGVDTASQYV